MTNSKSDNAKSENLYAALRYRILNGLLAPEQSLRLRTIALEFDASPTPVREALNRLQAENLVTMEANKGFRVAPVSWEGLHDLEEARAMIETQLLRRSIEKGDRNWEANLVSAHYRLSKSIIPSSFSSSIEIDAWDVAHNEFHIALIAGADSKWLLNFARQIQDQLHRYRRHILLRLDQFNSKRKKSGEGPPIDISREVLGIAAHTALMDAALARDAAQAEALMSEHIQLARATFLKLVVNAEIEIARKSA